MVFTLTTGVYLHTAYAQASDGSVGFSTTSATDAAYLGQYTDGSAADATDPSRYTWTPIDLGEGAELVEADEAEVDDGTDGLIDLLDRALYDTGQFAPDAQATGDRKVQTYFQPDEPDPEEYVFGVGDLWHDTDDGNHLYRWDGTAWVDAQDGGIGAAAELAQAGQEVLNGLTVVDANGVTKVNGGRIDTDTLFAQDITATGTITGARLIGAILSGDAIDIQAETGNERLRLGTSVNAETNASAISMSVKDTQSNASAEVTVNAVGVTMDGVQLDLLGEWIAIGDANVASETEFYGHVVLPGGNLEDKDYSSTKHTNFSGSVISSGSVVVTKKLGMCCISGTLTLSKSISAWTTILSGSKVPTPQHGELVPFEASQWGTSYARPLRGKITPDGELQLVYGAAGNYVINISYPID